MLRCSEIIADGLSTPYLPFDGFLLCDVGGCEIDKAYTGPQLPKDPTTGKYIITLEFIREMMGLFKDGKTLPKRYVWEIALGAYSVFEKEPSLVELTLENGKSVDVIGDVHGMCFLMLTSTLGSEAYGCCPRTILRRPQTIPTYWGTNGGSCSVDER